MVSEPGREALTSSEKRANRYRELRSYGFKPNEARKFSTVGRFRVVSDYLETFAEVGYIEDYPKRAAETLLRKRIRGIQSGRLSQKDLEEERKENRKYIDYIKVQSAKGQRRTPRIRDIVLSKVQEETLAALNYLQEQFSEERLKNLVKDKTSAELTTIADSEMRNRRRIR